MTGHNKHKQGQAIKVFQVPLDLLTSRLVGNYWVSFNWEMLPLFSFVSLSLPPLSLCYLLELRQKPISEQGKNELYYNIYYLALSFFPSVASVIIHF